VTLARQLLFAIALAAPAVALADDAPPAPTEEDLAAAKKAFGEGKKLFDKGKYAEAVEKFKESYRLSKNPLLLYNIALTFERLENAEKALFYYRKFLKDAPEDAAQRPDAEKSVKALEQVAAAAEPEAEPEPEADVKPPEPEVDPEAEPEVEPEPEPEAKPKKKRVAASYTADDFQHTIIDDAPPAQPLDLTAFAPPDAGWTVTLYYRGAGDDKFTGVPMVPRYNELVARIPAAKMGGNAVQYYVEVKDGAGELIQRVGKSSSPNVVFIDAAAPPRFYPDFDGAAPAAGGGGGGAATSRFGDTEDPLAALGGGGGGDGGPKDTQSSTFGYLKWGTTGVGGGMLILSVTFYAMASSWASSLEAEASASNDDDCAGGPPCRTFDDHRQSIEATGERYETISKITFGLGLAVGAAAGYLWYRERQAKKKGDQPSLVVAPALDDDFLGGAAAIRF
jgi:tetratricopeptide (TPR) repeat protein